jgi:hypothetical protein
MPRFHVSMLLDGRPVEGEVTAADAAAAMATLGHQMRRGDNPPMRIEEGRVVPVADPPAFVVGRAPVGQ